VNRHAIGVQIGATTSPAELSAVVAEAERLGYGEIWLAEDYFDLGGIASAATALGATDNVPIGLGVVAAPARHPAATAMEFATLGGVHPGRFMAGVGHGAPEWVRQMGLLPASPLTLLRESAGAIRQLLDGAELSFDGDYFGFDRVRLTHTPGTPIPLYLGVHGPASLRLSGELADGTLLGWFSSPSYVSWARERIDEGRGRVGRIDVHELVALCLLSVSEDDPDTACRDIGVWASPMLKAMTESPQLKASPVRSDLLALIERGQQETPTEPLPTDLLTEFVAAGDLASCRTMVDRLLEAGADRVVLVPNPAGLRSTSSMVEQMRAAALLIGGGSHVGNVT
jgi:alkanesulfonate monooxygenase SsuD/methylene tetrahydromethanopterin reductase-like flavin-dependent oxidoreductase (luciferase family)